MAPRKNSLLLVLFGAYFVCCCVLFCFLPRMFSQPLMMPTDITQIFLFTPFPAVLILGIGVRLGLFSSWAVGLFVLAAIGLGFGFYWIGLQLTAVV